MKNYTPKTIDTSRIELPRGLEELIEVLAQNNHDHWARQRIREGWRYGLTRDDGRKEHPDLIPYDELPEAEKEYDRNTVIEGLKAILASGYTLTKCA